MGVDVDVYFVDWEDFDSKIVRLGESAALEDLTLEPLTINTWRTAGEFVRIFEAMGKRWRTPNQKKLENLLGILFWGWLSKEPVRVMELAVDPIGLNGIGTAISPARVRDLAVLAASVDLSECEGLFREAKAKEGPGRFETFSDYRAYAEEWFGLLRRAAETGKGFLVVAFG